MKEWTALKEAGEEYVVNLASTEEAASTQGGGRFHTTRRQLLHNENRRLLHNEEAAAQIPVVADPPERYHCSSFTSLWPFWGKFGSRYMISLHYVAIQRKTFSSENLFLHCHFLEKKLFQTEYLGIVFCPVSLLIYF